MKKMGKVVAGVVSLVAASMVFSGCGTNQASETATEKETVTLWAGGSDNVKVGMDKIVDAFNESEAGEKYELKLQFILSGTGTQSLMDRIVAAKKTDQKDTDYDLILASDADYATYVQDGSCQKKHYPQVIPSGKSNGNQALIY